MRTDSDPTQSPQPAEADGASAVPPPPASAEAVIKALTDGFDGFSEQLQRAARFLIDHPREVGVRSMRALSAKASVHPNTLVRLAQAIGFDGFDALRERFRDFVAAGGVGGYRARATWLQSLEREGGASAVIAAMAEATAANLETMWRRQDAETLDQVARAMLEARQAFVLGMGSAYSLAHQFWYVARMAVSNLTPIPRHGSQPIDDLAWIGPEDLLIAITVQPYRAETMAAARVAKERGARLVGVTDSATSPLAKIADHVLISPTHTPQFFQSHSALTALLEGLLAVLAAQAGDEAAHRIEAFHLRRLEAGVYEEPAPLAQLGPLSERGEGA